MNVNVPVLHGEELLQLLQEKGKLCVSIILPTHRVSADRKIDKFQMEKALDMVRQALKVKYNEEEYGPLLKKLEVLSDTVDYNHNLEGLGLYVSEDVEMMVRFPFHVEEKIMVGDNFEIRDLLQYTQITKPYLALMVSEKQIRLFSGNGTPPKEIRGEDFPMEYTETYLYNTPSRGSSQPFNSQMRSFEHDKSHMNELRHKAFFRASDDLLKQYMIQEHASLAEIGELITEVLQKELKHKIACLIDEFREKIGEGRGVAGIQEVWSVAGEGRGWKLIVEKDYKVPGFVRDDNPNFLLLKPVAESHKTLADAVDDIMEEILRKGGEVYIAENGELTEFDKMILITRFQ
ncbi:MAG: hypothetical protein LW630_07010 [Saprospiraceae bacterium]|nr:hypothetical protein [Saprospiraceae bacterium]